MEMCFLIHISTTNYSIFKCNTSMCRYGQVLHFVYLQQKRLTCFWGRYDQNIENCSRFTVQSTFSILHIHLQLHFHFPLVSDVKVISRNIIGIFYIVACNYSRLVKRFVIYYESFIVIVDSVLYLILILFLLSGNAIGTHLLRDYYSDHYQTSMKDRPYLRAVHALF